jgi:hypothetical protein
MPWAVEPITPARQQEPPPPPPAKPIAELLAEGYRFVAVKDFQFRGEKMAAGEEVIITPEDAEKLGPKKVQLLPPPAPPQE